MRQNLSEPWNPERRWSYMVIAALAAMIFVLLGEQARVRHLRPEAPATEVTAEGRIDDVLLALPKVLGPLGGQAESAARTAVAEVGARPGWDQALLAIHSAEAGDLELGARQALNLPGEPGATFRKLWLWAYRGQGPAPQAAEIEIVAKAMGHGYAARILEARCLARTGAPAKALEAAAQAWATTRLMAMGALCAGGLLLGLGGLGFGLYLSLRPARAVLPVYRLPGRAVLIVLLGWFLTLMLSAPAIGILLAFLPFLRPLALPLAYGFHAGLGLTYLCAAEGISLAALWKRALPGRLGQALLAGAGFFALAFAAVMAMGMLLSPLLRHAEPPQKDLMELLTHLKGPWVVTLVFLTVAVAAPVFEELLFRGFLLPWLGTRLEARLGPRGGWQLAIFITAVTFAAMHMQPWGLPTLGTLGFVLGLAYVRTGNLGTAILVHGLWNGGVFILMRLVAA